MLRRVALVRTDVSEELSASIISVIRISELGTMLVVLFLVPCCWNKRGRKQLCRIAWGISEFACRAEENHENRLSG
jgi:hypothetical protein